MICTEDLLKPGKRENVFFPEYWPVDTEKIGAESPDNEMFYAYIWDPKQKKRVARLICKKDLPF